MIFNKYLRNQWVNWNNAAILLVMVAIIVAFKITRPAPPPLSLVNGTFRNPCCAEIRLENGYAVFGGKRIHFDLERDKNGMLVAHLPRRLYVSGSRIVDRADADGSYLVFETDRGGFELSTLEAPNTFGMAFQRVGS